jgi:molybdenum cofactor guanylyltransferase
MGMEKARLRLGRRTMMGHIRAAAIEAGLPVRVIRRDTTPRCGPMGGVFTALRTSKAGVVVFLSCDMPFVTGQLLTRMLRQFKPQTVALFAAGDFIGFPFVLRRELLALVESMLIAKRLSIQELALQTKAERIDLNTMEARMLFNVNTPQDLERARQLWGLSSG